MQIKMLKAKLHRATVSQVELEYEGSIGVDAELLLAAGILPNEAVHVWNVTNGNRFETYAIELPAGSRGICVNGAAAHLTRVGDQVIIASFCWLDAAEAPQHTPRVLLLDEHNHIKP